MFIRSGVSAELEPVFLEPSTLFLGKEPHWKLMRLGSEAAASRYYAKGFSPIQKSTLQWLRSWKKCKRYETECGTGSRRLEEVQASWHWKKYRSGGIEAYSSCLVDTSPLGSAQNAEKSNNLIFKPWCGAPLLRWGFYENFMVLAEISRVQCDHCWKLHRVHHWKHWSMIIQSQLNLSHAHRYMECYGPRRRFRAPVGHHWT